MKTYIRKNKKLILILFIFTFLFGFQKIFFKSVGYDTASYIIEPEVMYRSWYSHSRYMLVFIKRVIPFLHGHLHIINAITYLNVFIYTVLFLGFLNMKRDLEEDALCETGFLRDLLCGIFLISAPSFLEQYYFVLQSMEISLGFIFITITFIFTWKIFNAHNKRRIVWYSIINIIIIFFTVSMYQYFALMFIFGVVICLLKLDSEDCKVNIKLIVLCVATLAAGMALYYLSNNLVLNTLHIPKDNYLGNEWSRISHKDAFLNILASGYVVLLGRGSTYNLSFSFCAIYVFYKIISSKKKLCFKNLYYIGLLITPFIITIVFANMMLSRTSMATAYVSTYVFFCAFGFRIKRAEIYKYLLILYSVVQIVCCQILTYSDYVRYNNDVKIANEVYKKCNAEEDTEIYFIGIETTEENVPCFRGEVIGSSFFEWGVEPETVHQGAVHTFMASEGLRYKMPSGELEDKAINAFKKGSISSEYPEDGYVLRTDEGYIVNLGRRVKQ